MAVSEKITFGCLPDRISTKTNPTLAAGAEASASFAVENVLDYDLSVPWRCGYHSSRHSWITVNFGGAVANIGALAFLGNLSQSCLYRFRCSSTSGVPSPLWERTAPDAVISSSGATANDGVSAPDVTEIDEDCDTALATPDGGARIQPGSGNNIRLSFGTPSSSPRSGEATQEFRIVAGLFASGTAGSGLTIELFETGGGAALASWKILEQDFSTTIREYVFQWDAALLSTADGSAVEIKISNTAISGTVDKVIEAVEWNCYLSGSGSYTDYDSGVVSGFDTFSSQEFGDAVIADGFEGINWLIGAPLTSVITDCYHIRVEFWDRDVSNRKHSTYAPDSYYGVYDTAWGPVEIETLLAGPSYTPTYGMTRGWSVSAKDYAKVTRNRIGSTVYKKAFKKRKLSVTLRHVPHEEAMQNVFLWLGLEAGFSAPVVVFPEPTRTGVQALQNGLYRLVSEPKAQNSAPGRSHITLDLEEW